MKVLSVCTSDSSGGAARAAYRIHQAVKEFDIDSRMFVKDKGTTDADVVPLSQFIPGDPFYRAFDWMRNKVKNKCQHYQWGKYPNRSSLYMSDLRSTDIGGALQKLEYDVLHLHWINQRFLPLDRLPKDKPIVWTLHDSWPFCGVCHVPMDCHRYRQECGSCPALGSDKPGDLSRQVWRRKRDCYQGLNLHVVAPSRWMGDCVNASSLLGRFPMTVIPNCLDTRLFCPGNRAEACCHLGLDPEKKHIVFGAMSAVEDKNKGYGHLVNALMQAGVSFEGEVDVVIYGTDQTLPDRIGSVPVRSLGLIRESESMAAVYRAAAVTVVPSLSENLSCTMMESLSCGTPVVAFNIGGNGDMIDHQVNGYLAREQDDADLAAGILWCLLNNHDGHLSENARKKVLENYTPEIVGKQYAALYQLAANVGQT